MLNFNGSMMNDSMTNDSITFESITNDPQLTQLPFIQLHGIFHSQINSITD